MTNGMAAHGPMIADNGRSQVRIRFFGRDCYGRNIAARQLGLQYAGGDVESADSWGRTGFEYRRCCATVDQHGNGRLADSGMLDLRVLSFTPEDSRRIAQALLEECVLMINNLSAIAREDAIKYAREELDIAIERLKTARLALTSFRNRTQIVDPTIDTQSQMGLLNTLQQQLAESFIELDLLADTTSASDPRIVQAQRRVEVIESRIEAERRELGLGENAQGSDVFATLVGEYEGLIVDREFAEKAYTSALATFDGAQADARKQSRYLAAHIRPTLAEKAEYPERGIILLLMAVFLLFGWAILALIYYSLRDRR